MKRPLRRLAMIRLWLIPGMRVKRHVAVAAIGTLILIVGVLTVGLWIFDAQRQVIAEPIEEVLVSDWWRNLGWLMALLVMLLGVILLIVAIGRLNRSLLSNWTSHSKDAALVISQRLTLSRGPRIVAIGGGTGLSNLLRGLRYHTSNVTAVVTVSDDGGSSGRLRTAFNMPAPGDLSDCLAALSDNELEVSRLLQYRFHRGGELEGHTFGNLLITTLTEVEGDFARAIRVLNNLLNLTGSVFPITPEPIALTVRKCSGEVVSGESHVRERPGAIERVMIEPTHPSVTPEVIQRILDADVVVLGPGSLFTSTIPPLLVPAANRALMQTNAKLIYICNIMTEAGETDNFSAFDHVAAIGNHLGRHPEVVLVNHTPVDEQRLQRYLMERAEAVRIDLERFAEHDITVMQLPLLSHGPHAQHDSRLIADTICSLAKDHLRLSLATTRKGTLHDSTRHPGLTHPARPRK
jgi:uncharacterized cofD-like protein